MATCSILLLRTLLLKETGLPFRSGLGSILAVSSPSISPPHREEDRPVTGAVCARLSRDSSGPRQD